MSSLDKIKTKLNTKLVFILVMSFLLSACGAGGGGDDSVENTATNESQVPTNESQTPTEEEQIPEVAAVQISSQPQSLTKNSGENASFTVSASGGGSLSFQWRKNEQAIQGETSNILALSNLSASDAALYDVVVTNSVGSQYSLAALLTVNTPVVVIEPTVEPVVIVSQPQALTVDENASASFSVQVRGDGEISYQWLKNGQAINGASTASLSINTTRLGDAGIYSVRVENSEGVVVSNSVALAVTALPEPIVIVTQPQSITADENAAASFSVQVRGDGEITYQWLKDGEIIDGQNSATLNLSSVTSNDNGSYSVIVSNSIVSEVASLSVTIEELITTIELTWDIPQAREDGSDLSLGEINGYVIVYGTDEASLSNQLVVDGASNTVAQLSDLASGTYYFAIATVDSDGVQGAYSSVIQQSI